MRLTRSLIMVLAAIAVASCARQPVSYVQVASPPPGIDNVVYGQAAAPPMAMPQGYPAAGYGAPPPARYVTAPAVGYAAPSATSYVAAPAPGYAPAPARGFVNMPAPGYAAAPARGFANTPAPRVVLPTPYVPTVNDGPYALDSGDRLRVVVFGQDGLTNSYVVDASGRIDMPLIGSVPARGATTDQLAGRIAGQLRDGYIREPHVAVEIEAYRPFFILGEVTAPGQYPFVANMTVETAVAIAGGFGPRGVRDHVTITRNVGGRLFRFAAPTTYPVRPGDTITIPERWF
jgi:polysaccharide biosynthesis/export protein